MSLFKMQAFTFATVSFALVLAASAGPVEEIPHNDFFTETHECVPEKRFIDQCNFCVCAPDGKSAACTKMACSEPEKPMIDGYKDGFACAPGKIFYDGCKSCTCGESGNSAECDVVKDCEEGARRRRSVEEEVSDKSPAYPHIDNFHETGECNPGKSFYHECNTCHCSTDGKNAGCTLMACPGYDTIRIDNFVEGQKCPAGKTFKDRCNSCSCNDDGTSAICTLMECPGSE